VQQAAGTAPVGVSLDTVQHYYRGRRPEGGRADHRGRVRHDAQAPGGRRDSVLDIRTGDGRQLEWDWELLTDRVTMRAIGTGSAAGDTVSLVGRPTGFLPGGSLQTVSFSLTREGPVLRGTFTSANNLSRGVELRRDRP